MLLHGRVSVATVSHVINGTHYVSPDLSERVNEAIETLKYRPNKLARALNRMEFPLLALIVPDISNPYWSSQARAVQSCLQRSDGSTDADRMHTQTHSCQWHVSHRVYQAAKKAGMRIPQDISVVGFDSIQKAAFFNPPFTKIDWFISDTGMIATEMVIRLVRGETLEHDRRSSIPVWSSGNPAGALPEIGSHWSHSQNFSRR